MFEIHKRSLEHTLIEEINSTLDLNGTTEGFEILVPPQSIDFLAKFKTAILQQCPSLQWDNDSYVVIRTVTEKGARAAQCYHFDNFKNTAVLVLKSSTGDDNGDLLVRHNLRREYSSVILYMASKIFWTNPLAWFIFRIPYVRDRFFTRISLQSGDILSFNGGVTYHGNLPVKTGGARRSILIHNKPLFKDALVTKVFHRLNSLYLHKNK